MYDDDFLEEVSDDTVGGLLRIDHKTLMVVYCYQSNIPQPHFSALVELGRNLGVKARVVKLEIRQNPKFTRRYRPQPGTVIILQGEDERLVGKLFYDSVDRLEKFLVTKLPS